MILNKPTFANNFDFIWIFSYSNKEIAGREECYQKAYWL